MAALFSALCDCVSLCVCLSLSLCAGCRWVAPRLAKPHWGAADAPRATTARDLFFPGRAYSTEQVCTPYHSSHSHPIQRPVCLSRAVAAGGWAGAATRRRRRTAPPSATSVYDEAHAGDRAPLRPGGTKAQRAEDSLGRSSETSGGRLAIKSAPRADARLSAVCN